MLDHNDTLRNNYIPQILSKLNSLYEDPAEVMNEVLRTYLEAAAHQKISGLWSQANDEKDIKFARDLVNGLDKNQTMRQFTNMLNASPYLPKNGSPLHLILSAFFSAFEAYRPALLKRVLIHLSYEEVWTKKIIEQINSKIDTLDKSLLNEQLNPTVLRDHTHIYVTLNILRPYATHEQSLKMLMAILPKLNQIVKNEALAIGRNLNGKITCKFLMNSLIPQIPETEYWSIVEAMMDVHKDGFVWTKAAATRTLLHLLPYLSLPNKIKLAGLLLEKIDTLLLEKSKQESSCYLYFRVLGALKEVLSESERRHVFDLLCKNSLVDGTPHEHGWETLHEDIIFCKTLPYFAEYLTPDIVNKITALLLEDLNCYNISLRTAAFEAFKYLTPYISSDQKKLLIAKLLKYLSMINLHPDPHPYGNMMMKTLHLFKAEMTDDQQNAAVKFLFSRLNEAPSYFRINHFRMEDCHTLTLFQDKLTLGDKQQAISFLLSGIIERDERCCEAACKGLADFAGLISVTEQEKVRSKLIEFALSTNSEAVREQTCEALKKYYSSDAAHTVFQQIAAAFTEPKTQANACAVFNLLPELVPDAQKENMTNMLMNYIKGEDLNLFSAACSALQHFLPATTIETANLLLARFNSTDDKVRKSVSKTLTELAYEMTLNQQTCLLNEISKRIETAADDITLQLYANILEVYRKAYISLVLSHPVCLEDNHLHAVALPLEITAPEIINRVMRP